MDNSSFNRREFLKTLSLGALATALPGFARSGESEHTENSMPNIVFFLVDDMGWMDSTVYGSQYYETPNMDRLARSGMVFTNAYAANPLCSPTRASIMSGKYPARLKFTRAHGHLPDSGKEPDVSLRGAPRFKVTPVGCRTYLPLDEYTIAEALKDAGYRTGFIGKWHMGKAEKYWPEYQGFDTNLGGGGYPGPPGGYFDPYKNARLKNRKEGEYITDRLTDEALAYMETNRDNPFLLCLWHYAVHGPWGHKEEITQKYRGREDPRGKQGNPVMASMLWSVDESLGRLLDKLDELNIADKTIVILMSDNGGNIHSKVEDKPPTNNAPLRGGKATIYEGGTREPMIVKWPGVVRPGTTCSETVSSIDFYPTMLDMAGVEKRSDHLIDGESIVPLLKDTGKLEREAIFCHFPHYVGKLNKPSTYCIKGDWKLIRFYGEGETNKENGYELYNLTEDIGEENNLADKMPDRVRELDDLIDEFLKDTGALVPLPNPDHDPRSTSENG